MPDNETEAQRLARRVKGYCIHNNELYRRSTPDESTLKLFKSAIWCYDGSRRSMESTSYRPPGRGPTKLLK